MTVDPATDPVGQLIAGRYSVEAILGRGGQGIVCRARDNQSGNAVAVKLLNDASARDPQIAGRFLREQAALQALAGTSAVQVYDAGKTDDGSLYLVLELLEGRDLEEELAELEARKEFLSLRRIAELVVPLVTTLDAAHEKGIFHRDLKPANLFLLRAGGVRLLDFGFARLRSSKPLTAVGMVMGSPCYIAPEVWRGRPDLIDHRVDLYSLAVILFRLLTGALPFEAESLSEVLVLTTTAPRPSMHALRTDLPKAVDDWALTALAIDREQRFGSAGRCLERLFESLGARELLSEVQKLEQRAHDPQRSSAAEKVASILNGAAAALKRWKSRAEQVVRAPAGPSAAPANEPSKPAAEAPAKRAKTKSKITRPVAAKPALPVIPKLAPRAPKPKPLPAPTKRKVAPPPPASGPAARPGVLPPPPTFSKAKKG